MLNERMGFNLFIQIFFGVICFYNLTNFVLLLDLKHCVIFCGTVSISMVFVYFVLLI